jgi:hypothetical protein
VTLQTSPRPPGTAKLMKKANEPHGAGVRIRPFAVSELHKATGLGKRTLQRYLRGECRARSKHLAALLAGLEKLEAQRGWTGGAMNEDRWQTKVNGSRRRETIPAGQPRAWAKEFTTEELVHTSGPERPGDQSTKTQRSPVRERQPKLTVRQIEMAGDGDLRSILPTRGLVQMLRLRNQNVHSQVAAPASGLAAQDAQTTT